MTTQISSPAGLPLTLEPGFLYVVDAPAGADWLMQLGQMCDAQGEPVGCVDEALRGPEALYVERVVGYAADMLLDALEVEARRARLKEVLAACGLAKRLQTKLGALERDERVRVGLAIEALRRPALLVVTCEVGETLREACAQVAALGSAVVCAAPDKAALPHNARRISSCGV
jgi:hypothetical protein